MSAPWKNIAQIQTVKLDEIMNEEVARGLQAKEDSKKSPDYKSRIKNDVMLNVQENPGHDESEGAIGFNPDEKIPDSVPEDTVDSDELLAKLLQAQFDMEYDEQLKIEERARNKESKVSISLKNHRLIPEELIYDEDEYTNLSHHSKEGCNKKDFDRFETNEKETKSIPKCGYKIDEEGGIVTKHNEDISGRRNACKAMSFPPEFHVGDGAGFDMKLSNKVFNQLNESIKSHSKKCSKKNKVQDRTENIATTEMGLDAQTRLILYKLINNQVLENVGGVISTGKEAILLYGETDPANPALDESQQQNYPKEVAVKIFSTTLNEFKQRDRYIKDDYRFQGRFSKQNARTVINQWAEKELHNLNRMKKHGINCPNAIILKKNILIMSFIGVNAIPAKKLKEAFLSAAELILAYEEIVEIMWKLYNEARLIHADLSEYNILWFDEKCWIIDVAQSVEPGHPAGLEFLMRDCGNISTFFTKRNVPNVKTKEELFYYITKLDPFTHNTIMLERIHMKGDPEHIATRNQHHIIQTDVDAGNENETIDDNDGTPEIYKPLEYPFDYAWKTIQELKEKENNEFELKLNEEKVVN
uniref:Serine/threonine-protein kinase RIO3 n=1 Tax=Corethrella appendiculata TaxID=1370023 RepID=U5EX34_9DIPT